MMGCAMPARPTAVALQPTPTAAPTPTPLPEVEATAPPSNVTLHIWLPPEFAPSSEGAGLVFAQRLAEFTARRPGVQVETRIKAVYGPGGILDTLKTAKAAAPLALPDLVLLPYGALEQATEEGLLHTFDGLTAVMDDPDWFELARQVSHVNASGMGIPFALDALALGYRPQAVDAPPATWDEALSAGQVIAFPAADPGGTFLLALYLSAQGTLPGGGGQGALDILPLTTALTLIAQGGQNQVFPVWLTQFETEEQAWAAYQEGQADMVAIRVSRLLPSPDVSPALLPASSGTSLAPGDGWAWALAAEDATRQHLAVELAEFLSASEFVSIWSRAAGYLPARPSALQSGWENHPEYAMLNRVIAASTLVSPTLTQTLGPLLQAALLDVLKEGVDPAIAAQEILDALNTP
ncbi:MAG: extracellular solute-binding protein [Anaerolineae bacterium]|nr:MAG: extracellular solute-binding protein [Anaerolineae bacterium]